MIADLLKTSSVVEVVADEPNKVVLRVLDEKAWVRLMGRLLRAVHGADTFSLEVHKVFHAQMGRSLHAAEDALEVRFTWVVIHWGDPAEVDGLAARLAQVFAKPPAPPPFALGRQAPAPRSTPQAVAAPPRPAKPRQAVPMDPAIPDSDDLPDEPAMVISGPREGLHRIRHERTIETDTGTIEVYSVPLAHVHEERFAKPPTGTVGLGSSKKFKAYVQGRGEGEFNPGKSGAL